MYSALRKVMPSPCSRGTPAARTVCGVHLAQRVLHPPPDGGLCLRGDLLADDVVDDGGKEIRVDRAVNIPYAVNDRAQSPIPAPQVRKLRLAVWKVHAHSPFVPVSGWVNFCGR